MNAHTAGVSGVYVYSATYRKDGAGLTETFPAAGGMPSEQVTYYFAATGQSTITVAQDLPGGPTRTYASTSYDTSGRVWTRVLGDPNGTPSNNVLRTYGYDARGRLFSLTATARVGSSGQSTVQSDTYEFDVNGNVAARKDAVAGQAECFGYDTRNRLNRAYTQTNGACAGSLQDVGPDPYERTYTYDAISRLTSQSKRTATAQAMTVSSYTYAASAPGGCVAGTQTAKPHAVTAVSGVGTSGYDCAGNMTSRTSPLGAFTQAWNSQGKLEQVTKTGYTALYIYGPNGQRLIQEEGSKRTVYLPGQEITSTGGAAATGARYITAGPGGPAAALRRTGTSAGTYYLGGDAQGSVSWSVSAASLAVTRARYYPYGQVRGTANAMPTDHGFVGQIEDDGTGLNYLNNRYQDPTLGVFISVDPLATKTGQPYLYAGGNPTTLSDPSGLEPGCGATAAKSGPGACAAAHSSANGQALKNWVAHVESNADIEGLISWLGTCTWAYDACADSRNYRNPFDVGSDEAYGYLMNLLLAKEILDIYIALGLLRIDKSGAVTGVNSSSVVDVDLDRNGKLRTSLKEVGEGGFAIGFSITICVGVCVVPAIYIGTDGLNPAISVGGVGLGGSGDVHIVNGGACDQRGWGLGASVVPGIGGGISAPASPSPESGAPPWSDISTDGLNVSLSIGARGGAPVSGGPSYTWVAFC